MLWRERRAVILGVAGSGKTLIAAEKARRLAAQGFDVLFTCFNRPLAEFLAQTIGRTERVTVSTSIGWRSGSGRRRGSSAQFRRTTRLTSTACRTCWIAR